MVSAANVLHDRNMFYGQFVFLHAFFSPLVSHGLYAQIVSVLIVRFIGQCLF